MREFFARIRKLQKLPRSHTFKPASTYGFRGSPRSSSRPGAATAPTIEEVRKIERAYMCRIHVKQGLLYFAHTDTPFTHEAGAEHRKKRMQEMLDVCT
jgi:hypothetical protein